MFVPIVIEEGQNMAFNREFRLPFVNAADEPIGQGGYGAVAKAVIARGYFLHEAKLGKRLLHDVSRCSLAFGVHSVDCVSAISCRYLKNSLSEL